MASTIARPSFRYNSFDTRSSTSSHPSDISSSADLTFSAPSHRRQPPDPAAAAGASRALVRARSADVVKGKAEQNLGSMVKRFMERRSKPRADRAALVLPADFIAEDLKKKCAKGSNLAALPKKLFQKAAVSSSGKKEKEKAGESKVLMEVKANTRTLAMVLRSERELLRQTKEEADQIAKLRLLLEEKNREVEKLKGLCLNQREEIKALKSAVLFPDVMNSHLQDLLEKQGSELKQAKKVIPTLQEQVYSLTGKLQCLAEDLAEVKADKYALKAFDGHVSSPRTPIYEQEATNSLEFSSGDPMTPIGSLDDMILKDLNPCLTPHYGKSKSKDHEMKGFDSVHEELFGNSTSTYGDSSCSSSYGVKISKSSDHCQRSNVSSGAHMARKSDESKCTYAKLAHQKLF